ncbi:FtsH protease activity modulator HflK [Megalodesulfovibrio gigas]|uniref:Protein HflK n=1 Tax=Megalodesulfovibrio gigas (strain ATCC 19364 / DSM 1382 / NCIMB 9332 / VKM B-1759) TaxID=1121448 RepID=T2GAV5_MEGG1|nr:FtsH protease activity modulator HflK [Megalodesulfovibrio gigas]AGW13423.1 putative HflK protein [Megalodesulfovibrio gigas DSM 1382 = ATCC 19364]
MNWDWDKLNSRKPQGPWGPRPGNGPEGPDLDKLKDVLNKLKTPGARILLPLLAVVWMATGFYSIGPAEVGVVLRFGAFHRITDPGWHYHIPYPVEHVLKPEVMAFRRVEVGFLSMQGGRQTQQGQNRSRPEESLMLTGDENIVDVQFIVQYRIKDPTDFLFNVQSQDDTVKHVAEAAMREVVGYNLIDNVLTDKKEAIQLDTLKLMQGVLDRYQAGIYVEAVQLQDVHPPREVVDDFKDVASAREDKNRFVNEAQAYSNDILPRARGEAARIINDARGAQQGTIHRAEGEAARFSAVLEAYRKAPDITRERLQLEAMEHILANQDTDKLLLDAEVANRTTPYFQLAPPEALAGQPAAAPGTPGAPAGQPALRGAP